MSNWHIHIMTRCLRHAQTTIYSWHAIWKGHRVTFQFPLTVNVCVSSTSSGAAECLHMTINTPNSYRWIDGCGVVNGSRRSMTIWNSFAIACMGFPFSCGTNPNVFVTLLPEVNHPTSVNEKLEACIQSVTSELASNQAPKCPSHFSTLSPDVGICIIPWDFIGTNLLEERKHQENYRTMAINHVLITAVSCNKECYSHSSCHTYIHICSCICQICHSSDPNTV